MCVGNHVIGIIHKWYSYAPLHPSFCPCGWRDTCFSFLSQTVACKACVTHYYFLLNVWLILKTVRREMSGSGVTVSWTLLPIYFIEALTLFSVSYVVDDLCVTVFLLHASVLAVMTAGVSCWYAVAFTSYVWLSWPSLFVRETLPFLLQQQQFL